MEWKFGENGRCRESKCGRMHLRQWWYNLENDRCLYFWISFCPNSAWASYRVRQTRPPRSTIVCSVARSRATTPYRCPMGIGDFAISMYHRIYLVNYLAVRIQFHRWIGIVIHGVVPFRPFPPDTISISNSFRHPIRPFRYSTNRSVHLLIATSYQLQWIDYCPCEWCRPPTYLHKRKQRRGNGRKTKNWIQ